MRRFVLILERDNRGGAALGRGGLGGCRSPHAGELPVAGPHQAESSADHDEDQRGLSVDDAGHYRLRRHARWRHRRLPLRSVGELWGLTIRRMARAW